MDQQLSFFHDLMIEQRAREGIPVHTEDGPTDGTHARNLFNLGETLLAKMKVVEAIDCFDTAARHGSVDAMFALGRIYNNETYALVSHAIPEEQRLAQPALENKSRYYLEKASNLGHANATFQLVIQCNSPPKGAEANGTLMMNALRVAVEEHEHPGAMLFLATFYEKGSHTDQLKAIELLRKVDTPEAHKRADEIYIRIANKNHTESEVLKDI
jgi:TPR repeat protein